MQTPSDDPQPPVPGRWTTPANVVVALALVAGTVHAWTLRWTCDDAFISFRYARNLVRGHGLVFNVGEAVEGYTNFLWTVGVAAGLWLGVDPTTWTHLLGVAAWASVGGMLWAHARARHQLPLAALLWAAFPYGRVFATSGLETMAFTALSLGGLLLAWNASRRALAIGAAVLASLALLTRPEGALTVAACLGLVAVRRPRWVLAMLVPIGVLVAPWLGLKLGFYGELLPNTYYAKAGAGPRWDAGLAYLALFFGANGVLGLGILGWLVPPSSRTERLSHAVLLGWLAVFTVHIARAGGDFMYARFCVPLVPLLCLGLAHFIRPVQVRAPRFVWAVLLLPVGVAAARAPASIFGDVDADLVGAEGVVDERSWYPPEALALAQTQGEVLRACVAKTPVRAVYYGTQAMLMYYADLPYALEPHVGLTDYAVARMPPPAGVRVGHGQKADTDYLRSRSIDLALGYRLQLPTTTVTEVRFPGGITGRLFTYRRSVVSELRACGAEVLDFEAFLDQWILELDTLDDDKVRTAYQSFSAYYFDHNNDPAREAPFRARLGLPARTK